MRIKYRISILLLSLSAIVVNGQSVDSLLQLAFENNPELRALQLEYEAALQGGAQVSQLPDPTVGVGIPILRPETRLGSQVLGISASQMFPWFGTLKAKEDIVLTMAKAKYERVAAVRLDLIYRVKDACYNLYLLDVKQGIFRENIRIFEALEKVSLAKVESGKAIASDVLSVQIKVEEFKKRLEVLEEQKQVFNAHIIEEINGSFGDTITITDTLVAPAEIQYDLSEYRRKIQDFHPLIRQIEWKIEASNKEIDLNSLSGKPTLGVGLDYSIVSRRTDASPADNGRDILIPKVMISIPVYRKKYTAKSEEERLKQEALILQKEQVENRMIRLIQSYGAEHQSALLMYELANSQLVISRTSFDILLAEYSGKGGRFDELMKLQSDIVKYELEIAKAIVQTHLAKIKIDRLSDF